MFSFSPIRATCSCHFILFDGDRKTYYEEERKKKRATRMSRAILLHKQDIIGLYVLLTVHLITVFVHSQLDAQFFFLYFLFQFSTCFEQPSAHHQGS